MDNLYNRVARRRTHGQGGFTLIELLVVIAVLAILAAIVIFNVVGVKNRGQASAACTDQGTIQTAVDAYFNEIGKYPIGSANSGGTSSDATTTTAGGFVDFDELLAPASPSKPFIHTAPNTGAANDGAFTYTNTSGTVAAANASGC